MAPTPSISDLANAAETALATYTNTQTTVATDQQKLAQAQQQLASDQQTSQASGTAAYTAVGTLIAALQQVQTGLPAPAPAPAPAPTSGS